MSSSQEAGHLSVFLGPMGSGKSTRAVEQVSQFCSLDFKTAYVMNDLDKLRNQPGNTCYSHNPNGATVFSSATSLFCTLLSDVDLEKYDAIIIDEAQFFSDLVDVVKKLVANGKYVQVYGLSGDFAGKKFGQVIDLIPFADVFQQMTAKCVKCAISAPGTIRRLNNASFTDMRDKVNTETDNSSVVKIGGMEDYDPVCRLHHPILCGVQKYI